MFKTKVISKETSSLGDERQSDLQQVMYILRTNAKTLSEMNNNLSELKGPIRTYRHAQNHRCVEKKQTSLAGARQPELLEVMYILRNNEKKLTEMNNIFLEVFIPILRY